MAGTYTREEAYVVRQEAGRGQGGSLAKDI